MIEKHTLVFVSGWGSGAKVWQGLEPVLAAHFDICHIDLMSFPRDSEALNGDVLVECIAKKIPEKSIVIGWSLGGMIAVKVAARFPEKIKKLILFATNLSFVETATWPTAMDQKTFANFKTSFQQAPKKTQKRFVALQAHGDTKRKQVVGQLESASNLNSDNQLHACALLDVLGEIELLDDLGNLTLPVQFIFGENDALVPVSAAEKLAWFTAVAVPDNAFDIVRIEQCGHAPQLSRAEHCLQHIFRFLELKDQRYKKDKKKIARSFSQAAKTYDRHAALQKDVANDLLGLADSVEGVVADLGCGTGYCIDLLTSRFPNISQTLAVDIAENMLREADSLHGSKQGNLHCVLADIENLPFASRSIDLFVSSLAMQWSDDLESLFSGVKNAMADSSRFLFSTLSENTLFELAQSWSDADPDHVHVNQFVPTKKIIRIAEENGFELLHFEAKRKVLEYDTVLDLMKDLKGIGAHNINEGINKGLTGKSVLSALGNAYEKYRNENGKLPATYDVEYWLLAKKRVIQ